MVALKFCYSDCISKLKDHGSVAHNHSGGYLDFKDFDYKAASFLINDDLIETVVTLFLDHQKTRTAHIVGHTKLYPGNIAKVVVVKYSPELSDLSFMLSILENALNTQISRIGTSGGRIPANAKVFVMQRKARFPKQIANVKEAAALGVIDPLLEDKMLATGMGMNKYDPTRKKMKKRKAR